MSKRFNIDMRHARPSLRLISPLAHWTVLIMALFNLILGVALFTAVDQSRVSSSLIIVNDVFTYKFWGTVFIAIGLLKAFSLKTNNWELAKNSLMVGVAVKAAWAVALTIRTLVSPGTVFLNLLWITIALLQMGAYIWFMPPALLGHHGDSNERN